MLCLLLPCNIGCDTAATTFRPLLYRELLAEKSTALEQLAARSQALDAAQLQIRELTAASHDRLQLAQEKAQVGGWVA